MTHITGRILATAVALAVATPLAVTPAYSQAQAQQRAYTQAELDRMLAPIALYPDPLLSQILMASTYPLEVVEAARWSRANRNLRGDDAVRAAQDMDWEPSVNSLVAFPQVLQRMDENLEWTRALGDAFLAQQPQLMDTVQQLRQRAQAAGNLQSSSEQIQVLQQGPEIVVQPVNPQYVYVPYYDPMAVYGTWWWPAYPPVVWAPWPGYVRHSRPGVSVSFWWGAPIGLSAGFFFGNVDWRQRHVHVEQVNNYYYRPPVVVNRIVIAAPGRWQHDPQHRRGVEYRDAAVRQQFTSAPAERRERRFERPPARDLHDSKVLTPPARPQPQYREQRERERAQLQQPAVQRQREQRARMPEAVAPQQPRAERQERRHDGRQERHQRGGERS